MQIDKLTLKDVATTNRQYLETIFALGDGHMGVRDSVPFTGNQQATLPVMLINGYYATNPITYGESAYGYAKNHQTIISLTSPRYLDFATEKTSSEIPGDWDMMVDDAVLDFDTGVLTEKFQIVTSDDHHFELVVKSMIALDNSHQLFLNYELTSLDYTGALRFTRPIIHDVTATTADADDPRVAQRQSGLTNQFIPADRQQQIKWQTLVASTHQQITQRDWLTSFPTGFEVYGDHAGFHGSGTIEVQTTLSWSFTRQISEINQALPDTITSWTNDIVDRNRQILTNFWQQSQVQISDKKLQTGIQYNLFQLFQSAGRNGLTNIAAKGITGPGYEGHYFWDTEMYMLPFFIYTQPQIAKQLLHYRFSILPQAQERARSLGVTWGALYAWRTINGEEASAYFPAGTAQYHINADIAHTVKLYFDVTNDQNFLREQGAAVVLETARFWLQFGSWQQRDGRSQFCLYKVTGPDEYTALVDNNYYTNRMAKENMAFAAWLLENHYIDGDADEQAQFTKASTNMYLPYDQEQQVTAQDDNSPKMPVWPFATTAATQYPLLLHYHPLMIYRHRVNKQADTLLAEMLFPEDQSLEQLRRDYEYYEPITTHDSSLSRSIFSILASRLGDHDKAFSYYMDTSLMDLVDLQGNAKDGLHEANLGGSWLGLTYGFAGMYVADGKLHITNHLPTQITHLSYRLRFRGRVLEVQLYQDKTQVKLVTGLPLVVVVAGKEYDVLQGARSE